MNKNVVRNAAVAAATMALAAAAQVPAYAEEAPATEAPVTETPQASEATTPAPGSDEAVSQAQAKVDEAQSTADVANAARDAAQAKANEAQAARDTAASDVSTKAQAADDAQKAADAAEAAKAQADQKAAESAKANPTDEAISNAADEAQRATQAKDEAQAAADTANANETAAQKAADDAKTASDAIDAKADAAGKGQTGVDDAQKAVDAAQAAKDKADADATAANDAVSKAGETAKSSDGYKSAEKDAKSAGYDIAWSEKSAAEYKQEIDDAIAARSADMEKIKAAIEAAGGDWNAYLSGIRGFYKAVGADDAITILDHKVPGWDDDKMGDGSTHTDYIKEGDLSDATSLLNFRHALDVLDKENELRAQWNEWYADRIANGDKFVGSPSTAEFYIGSDTYKKIGPYKVSDASMAIAQDHIDWSNYYYKKVSTDPEHVNDSYFDRYLHAGNYYSDYKPFEDMYQYPDDDKAENAVAGWMDERRNEDDIVNGGSGNVTNGGILGHYYNCINQKENGKSTMGAAVGSGVSTAMVWVDSTFYGGSGKTYTPAEYRQRFMEYYNKVTGGADIAALEDDITKQDVAISAKSTFMTQHEAARIKAQKKLDDANAKMDSIVNDATADAQKAADDAAAKATAADQALADAKAALAAAKDAVANAPTQAEVDAAHAARDKAAADLETAKAAAKDAASRLDAATKAADEATAAHDALVQARKTAEDDAKAASDADAALETAKAAVKTAKADLETAKTNLADAQAAYDEAQAAFEKAQAAADEANEALVTAKHDLNLELLAKAANEVLANHGAGQAATTVGAKAASASASAVHEAAYGTSAGTHGTGTQAAYGTGHAAYGTSASSEGAVPKLGDTSAPAGPVAMFGMGLLAAAVALFGRRKDRHTMD